MAWDPDINVLDETNFKTNVTTFLEDNQADALAWASSDADPLPLIREFHRSPRKVTLFPTLTWLQTSHTSAFPEDSLIVSFDIVLEVVLLHGKPDVLADRAPRYSMALESMIANLPETTLNANSIITIESTRMNLDTVFDIQRELKSEFIQAFQTKASWVIEASAFSE